MIDFFTLFAPRTILNTYFNLIEIGLKYKKEIETIVVIHKA